MARKDYRVTLPSRVAQRMRFLQHAGESASRFLERQIQIAWEAEDLGCNRAAIEAARQQYINETGHNPEDT